MNIYEYQKLLMNIISGRVSSQVVFTLSFSSASRTYFHSGPCSRIFAALTFKYSNLAQNLITVCKQPVT
jgi:hypothetical protein